MGDDTKKPSDPNAPPEGLRVVPVDLHHVMMLLLNGRPMPAVVNVILSTLGDVLVRVREIEVEARTSGTATQEEWETVRGHLLRFLELGRNILTEEDYAQAKNAYDQLGMEPNSPYDLLNAPLASKKVM